MRYLDSLAHGWPHVSYLADFMKVTTAPPKQKFINEHDRRARASRTKVAMLTFDPNTAVHRVDFSDINDLSAALNGPQNAHHDVHARLFVLEDLSRDVIEAFGARFDVDPLFFRATYLTTCGIIPEIHGLSFQTLQSRPANARICMSATSRQDTSGARIVLEGPNLKLEGSMYCEGWIKMAIGCLMLIFPILMLALLEVGRLFGSDLTNLERRVCLVSRVPLDPLIKAPVSSSHTDIFHH